MQSGRQKHHVPHKHSPSPQTPPPAPPGGAQGVPRPAERHSPSSVSWAVPWASSRWDVPGTPPEEGVQEASSIDARATSTGSSDVEEQRLYSEPLPDGRAPHPISKGVPGHPTEEAHFSRLYPGSRSFGHDPKFMAIGRNDSQRPIPNTKAQGCDPLIHWAKPQHETAELGGNKQTHTSPPPLPVGHSKVEESPAPLKEMGSRAYAVRGGEPDYF
ncbi:hypothetical protein CRENBAI_014380 [Crenichthys baileyi]|uniref:Uncharacterized protein n=1 Tax=Crenichthys baileyi TaxID=28760 RepID=A0AAV9RS12_9TELE